MFSNNGKISNHQATRLLILDVFTGACLFLPMALPRLAGEGGFLALILGLLLTLLDGAVLSWALGKCGSHYIQNLGGGWLGSVLRWIYGLRCFASFVFLMGMFSSVLNETFLYTMPKWLVIAGMVFVLIYGSTKGIEVRARLSEILFYLILIPILLIGLFSIPEGNIFRLLTFSETSFSGIVQGILVTWVLMAPVEWMLYIAPENPNEKPFRIFAWALGIGGGLTALIYALCVTVMTVEGMAGERWPTVILMQIVRIPGGFLSRQDGLMLSFWIFAMFISLSGALSHTVELWGIREAKVNRWKVYPFGHTAIHSLREGALRQAPRGKVWVCALAGAALAWWLGTQRQFLNVYFSWMLFSGAVLLWIVPCFVGLSRKRVRKIGTMVFALCLIGSLTGCENYVELENRAFVMALGVDLGEEETYRFTYTFPDLEALTGNGSSAKYPPMTLEADSLQKSEDKYNSMSGKSLDYGQVKVIVLGSEVVSDREKLKGLLEEIRNNPEFARTMLVCESLTSGEEVLELDEEVVGSIGIYMEEMFENNGKHLGIPSVILNDVILKMETTDVSEILPKVYIYDEKPRIMR